MSKTKIELTNKEAELFKTFREHQDIIELLIVNGVFELKNGKALLSFSSEGKLMNIKTEMVAFRRKKSYPQEEVA